MHRLVLLQLAAAFICPFFAFTQPAITPFSGQKVITEISISGNEKTRSFYILQELTLHTGDTITYSDLLTEIDNSESALMRRRIFLTVAIAAYENTGASIKLSVHVEERWHVFAYPYFSLADRNFNVWYTDYDHNLRRTIYGVNGYHFNLTGRGDRLKVNALFGFNQDFGIQYERPYISRNSSLGLLLLAYYVRSHDIYYKSTNNKEQYYRDENQYVHREFNSVGALTYKINDRWKTKGQAGFHFNRIADSVALLNPDYLLHQLTYQPYFSAGAEIIFESRNEVAYPTSGTRFSSNLTKNGLGILRSLDNWIWRTELAHYIPLHPRWSLGGYLYGKLSFGPDQPFHLYQGLGYDYSLVRGYELYVIESKDVAMGQATVRFKLLNFSINKPLISIPAFNNIPIAMYLKVHGDVGYGNDPYYYAENPLANTLLLGYGLGLDVVSYYDFVFSLHYSFNRMGKNGLFLHFSI